MAHGDADSLRYSRDGAEGRNPGFEPSPEHPVGTWAPGLVLADP